MNKFEEHEELINVVNKSIDHLKFINKEEQQAAIETMKMSIFLDISRSLAVIADALQAERKTL